MSSWIVVSGAVGVVGALAALLGTAMALAREGRWNMALAAIAGIAIILFLLMVGLEYADDFWKGRT